MFAGKSPSTKYSLLSIEQVSPVYFATLNAVCSSGDPVSNSHNFSAGIDHTDCPHLGPLTGDRGNDRLARGGERFVPFVTGPDNL